jgi:hypothetical protein
MLPSGISTTPTGSESPRATTVRLPVFVSKATISPDERLAINSRPSRAKAIPVGVARPSATVLRFPSGPTPTMMSPE